MITHIWRLTQSSAPTKLGSSRRNIEVVSGIAHVYMHEYEGSMVRSGTPEKSNCCCRNAHTRLNSASQIVEGTENVPYP